MFKLLQEDVKRFGFKKANGQANPNAFFNQILPNLLSYRVQKRSRLRQYMSKNFKHCIKKEYQDDVLSILDDLFDYVYFDDINESYHNKTIHLRLNKWNMLRMESFFDELDEFGEKRTSYLRNLLNEYTKMRQDERESICFADQHERIWVAMETRTFVTCKYMGVENRMCPLAFEVGPDGYLYVLAMSEDAEFLFEPIRLSFIEKVKNLDDIPPVAYALWKSARTKACSTFECDHN